MPTTYGNDIVYCLKSHCGVRGYCRQKWVLQVQIICKFSNERTCKRNKDVQGLSCGFEDNYRKIVRDQTFVDQTDNLYHLNLPQDSGFESTEGAYDLKEMHRIVNALPKEYKVPFSMHVSGFKYREIAEKLDLPLGTVKSRIFFTRQRLQQELKDFV
ncbi:Sigma-70, region 4 [Bacteroides thetaiotaomicron]|nr:Sigma-70, region 4 [Bacteroides thetaiotaomicron]